MISPFTIILIFILGFQTGDWRLDKNREGIKVYTREVDGFPIRQFSVHSHTTANLDAIESVMRDLENYISWMPDVSSCELLEKEDENTYIYHMVINAPFPVSDRDIVARMQFQRTGSDVLKINYENRATYMEEIDKAVRIPYFKGYWEFTASGDSTIIKNQFLSDPGGSVPAWVINSFISKNPYETVRNLREQVE
jgi:hypothetical protein